MKTLLFQPLLISIVSFSFLMNVFPADVTFKATVKTTENAVIPRVYVKIYVPGKSEAVDSMFTNNQGYIERELSFTSVPEINTRPSIIVRKLSPNIIAQKETDCSLEYNYPGKAQLFFIDVCGRKYANYSELSTGLYFYYLRFDDGMQSEINRMVVAAKSKINVKLISTTQLQLKTKAFEDADKFYAVFIKDGYITRQDTILIDNPVISKNYQLVTAAKPTAAFTFTGNLKPGEPVVFDASASAGANGEQLVYSWDFGNGKKGQANKIPHSYNTEGSYTVTLTVAGNYGATHSITKTVAIGSGPLPSTYTGVVKGFISDENNNNLSGVTVSLIDGDGQAISDNFGLVLLSNMPVGVPLYFKITKTGYVNQIVRLTLPSDTIEGLFYATLKSRAATITFSNAEYGGEIASGDGAKIALPIDGLVKPDGSVATGNVSVSVTPVDVAYNTDAFPGTFNALRSNGDTSVLLSLGVVEFNFEQSGKQLQIAPGKTASIDIPIYTSGAIIGDQIPLWSINESNGQWVEEGIGTVIASTNSPTGLAMKAEVGHLSWWNCDLPGGGRFKDGICYKIECYHGLCYRVKVGCWVNGAREFEDDESKKTIEQSKLKARVNDRETIPPVFDVREYISEAGMRLLFPIAINSHLQARAYDANGEMLIGNQVIKAYDEVDTFSIELKLANLSGDTITLPIDSTMEKYLDKDKVLHFKIQIPEKKLYRFCLAQGSAPKLNNGHYFLKKDNVIIVSGNVDGNSQVVLLDKGTVVFSVSTTTVISGGNFKIGLYRLNAAPIALNDSITDSVYVKKQYKYFSIQPDKNTVINAYFYRPKPSSASKNNFRILSSTNQILANKAITTTKQFVTIQLAKDSVYYIEFSGYYNFIDVDFTYHFVFITEEDRQLNMSYGDTIPDTLKYKYDVNMYHFTGSKDDIVSIKIKSNSLLSHTYVTLWNEKGFVVKYDLTNQDEIIYKVPSDGRYSVIVSGDYANTDYTISLNKIDPSIFQYNSYREMNLSRETEYYLKVEIPKNKVTFFSFYGSAGYNCGYELWNSNGNKIHTDGYQSSYPDTLTNGTYFLKIENTGLDKIYINIFEAKPLSFNEKGKAQFIDTIQQYHQINAYYFLGSSGDGVHAMLKTILNTSAPISPWLRCYLLKRSVQLSFDETNRYASLDTSILFEFAGTLDISTLINNTPFLIVTSGNNNGSTEFTMHYVKKSNSINVDDDFAQYPDAQTSSIHAAGYAVQTGGNIMIANGTYSSYLPLSFSSENIQITGQEKGNVRINCIANAVNYSAVEIKTSGCTIHNITACGGSNCHYAVFINNADNTTLENIDIKPISGTQKMYQSLNCYGDNNTLRNISITGTQYGITIDSKNSLIENCTINTDKWAIYMNSCNNLKIKNNSITLNAHYQAIYAANSGKKYLIENNQITVNNNTSPGAGIIKLIVGGTSSDNDTTYIRNNTILSAGTSTAIYTMIGTPPSSIVIEGNKYSCSYTTGGKALNLENGNTTGISSILVKNNIFDGLTSAEAIYITGVDKISQNQRFAIYNNNFRMTANAVQDTNFILVKGTSTSFLDTARLFIVNNIFQANGFGYLIKCQSNFSLYSDYNIVYNFPKYKGIYGNIIGTMHDITGDPLYNSDLTIQSGSPAINNGATPAQFIGIPGFDINGITRPKGTGYDIGAYEVE